jgi:hypothetical protein
MDKQYYCHEGWGTLEYDPKQGTKHHQPNWCLLRCDQQIVEYYCYLAKTYGRVISPNKLWNAHISAVKGEEVSKDLWGYNPGPIKFYYTNIVRNNECHAWIDCWSEDLANLRLKLGLENIKMSYHLTLGRLI